MIYKILFFGKKWQSSYISVELNYPPGRKEVSHAYRNTFVKWNDSCGVNYAINIGYNRFVFGKYKPEIVKRHESKNNM